MKNIRYINLSDGFNPFFKESVVVEKLLQGREIKYDFFTFKGGEPHIKIHTDLIRNNVDGISISHRVNSFNDLGKLLVTVDAIRRINKDIVLDLIIPYFPGARQDRLMVEGEPFTSAVYVKQLDSMGFNSITSFDLHSDVVGGMFGVLNTKFTDVNNHEFVLKVLQDIYPQHNAKTPILISPDAGSNKKIGKLAKYLSKYNITDVVKCDKTRDVKTGEITNFEVYADDLGGRDCIIVDDICDGGGTFLGLGKKLREKGCGNLYLVVTHGIFSQGFKNLNNMFNMIYTTDSIQNYDDTFREAHKHHKGFEAYVKEIKMNEL